MGLIMSTCQSINVVEKQIMNEEEERKKLHKILSGEYEINNEINDSKIHKILIG
jgi:hypothetical protein